MGRWAAAAVAWLALTAAWAQTPTPAASAASGAARAAAAPSERAKKEADDVFRWIKIHTDAPRKPTEKAATKLPTASTALANAKATEASKAAQSASAAASAAAATGFNEVTANPGAAALPVPEPVVSAKAPDSAPAVPAPKEAPLRPVAQANPQFPEDVMQTLGQGSVSVRFTVLPDGSVANAEVLSSSHRKLNRSALEAVAQWRFEPIPNARSARVELGFKLD